MKRLQRNLPPIVGVLIVSFAGNIGPRQLSPFELKEDISILRKGLEKYHPGLYWYTSKNQFDLTWDSLNAEIAKPMSEDHFFKLLLPVIAKVKCAHTLFYPSHDILTNGSRFPLDLKFINGQGYIMTDSSNEYQIPKGSELLAINKRSLQEITALMLPSLEAQGGNLGWKYVILENDFQNYYYYIIDHSENFEVEYIDHLTRQKVSRRINASAREVLRRHWKNWYPKDSGAPLQIKFINNSDVAIITIKSFSKSRYKLYGQDFNRLIESYFDEIRQKEIKNLIIDVRGNEGGNNPDKVYSYIAKENDKSPANKGVISKAKKNVFHGSVIVLMDQRSISAQEELVSIFKNNRRGLTIGKATPGSYNGLCGGNKRKIVLPNSHFEIQIPLHASPWTYTDPNQYREGEGFPPDFDVDETINDILSGKDPAMELAIDKIKKME